MLGSKIVSQNILTFFQRWAVCLVDWLSVTSYSGWHVNIKIAQKKPALRSYILSISCFIYNLRLLGRGNSNTFEWKYWQHALSLSFKPINSVWNIYHLQRHMQVCYRKHLWFNYFLQHQFDLWQKPILNFEFHIFCSFVRCNWNICCSSTIQTQHSPCCKLQISPM